MGDPLWAPPPHVDLRRRRRRRRRPRRCPPCAPLRCGRFWRSGCAAAPARGEYRAEGCCPLRRGPRTASPARPATWGDQCRPPLPSSFLREGRAPSEATRFPKVWTPSGPPPPHSPPPPTPLGGWPHTGLLRRSGAAPRASETCFPRHLSSGSWGVLPFRSAFPGVEGEPSAGCPGRTLAGRGPQMG